MTFRSIDSNHFRTQTPNTPYEKELFNVLFSKEVPTFSKENKVLHKHSEEKQHTSTGMRIKTMLTLDVPPTIEEENPQSRSVALTSNAALIALDNAVYYKNINGGAPEEFYATDIWESLISLSIMDKQKLLIGDLTGYIREVDITTKKVLGIYPRSSSSSVSGVSVVTGNGTDIFGGYSDGSLVRHDARSVSPSATVQGNATSVQQLYPRYRDQELLVQDEKGLIKLFDLRKAYDPVTVYSAPENRTWSAFTCCRDYQASFLATVNDSENESTLYRVHKTTGAIIPLQKINARVAALHYDFNKDLLLSHHNMNEKAIVYSEFEQKKERFKEKSFVAMPRLTQDEHLQTYTSGDKTVHGFLSKENEKLEIVKIEHPKVKDASENMYFTIR